MNFCHQKQVENSTSYSLRNAQGNARTLFEGTPNLRRIYELGRAGEVSFCLEVSWAGLGPRVQHFRVPLLQRRQKFFARYRRAVPVWYFDRQLIYTQDVV